MTGFLLLAGDNAEGGRGDDCVDGGSGRGQRSPGALGKDRLDRRHRQRPPGGAGSQAELPPGAAAAATRSTPASARNKIDGGSGSDKINAATAGPASNSIRCGKGSDKIRVNRNEKRKASAKKGACEKVYVIRYGPLSRPASAGPRRRASVLEQRVAVGAALVGQPGDRVHPVVVVALDLVELGSTRRAGAGAERLGDEALLARGLDALLLEDRASPARAPRSGRRRPRARRRSACASCPGRRSRCRACAAAPRPSARSRLTWSAIGVGEAPRARGGRA